MKIIVRCHIKNIERLVLLEQSLFSLLKNDLNDIYIVDDQSPMRNSVKSLCYDLNVRYELSEGVPSTINGLISSLKLAESFNEPCLLTVDDFVVSPYIKQQLEYLNTSCIPSLNNADPDWAMIGMFACYPEWVRTENKVSDLDIWKINWDILYALVGHIFSPKLIKETLSYYNNVQLGIEKDPDCCDDIMVARLCKKLSMNCYNTMKDYLQHTGMKQRSFSDQDAGNSEYISECFLGESK